MKKIFLLYAFIGAFNYSEAQTKVPAAQEVLQSAYKLASAQHKNVMLLFTASWCGWCRKMDASLNDSSCKKFFDDNYVIVHLTVYETAAKKNTENPGAGDLLKQLNAFNEGIPAWFIYDANGRLLGDCFMRTADGKKVSVGCPASEKEVEAFIKVLKSTSSLTGNALDIIATVFRRNDV